MEREEEILSQYYKRGLYDKARLSQAAENYKQLKSKLDELNAQGVQGGQEVKWMTVTTAGVCYKGDLVPGVVLFRPGMGNSRVIMVRLRSLQSLMLRKKSYRARKSKSLSRIPSTGS